MTTVDTTDYDRASQRWRSLWRIHFYSGIFAIPFILLMSVTGLAILYDQPIKDVVWKDLRTVTVPAPAMNASRYTSTAAMTLTTKPSVVTWLPVSGMRPAFAITHAPGCMLITDRRNGEFAVL